MINNDTLDRSGELNCLIANQILRNTRLSPEDREKLQKIVNSELTQFNNIFNFGLTYDIDLNEHECDYEMKKEIFSRLENKDLNKIYSLYQGYMSQPAKEEATINKNYEKLNFLPENQMAPLNSFGFLNSMKLTRNINNRRVVNKKETFKNYQHMKSMLGHISVIDDNIINPSPIYCVLYSDDNQLIFSGDNNGYIFI